MEFDKYRESQRLVHLRTLGVEITHTRAATEARSGTMPRDYQAEHTAALDGLRSAEQAYRRCLADCRESLRAKWAWVVECQRRVRQAEKRIKSPGVT